MASTSATVRSFALPKINDKHATPIWRLEVEYERFLFYNYTIGAYLRATEAIYDLLTAYPKKTMPADFLTPDIEDWATKRMERLSESSVRREVAHIHAFFKWMWYAKGIEVQNPAVVIRLNNKTSAPRLTY